MFYIILWSQIEGKGKFYQHARGGGECGPKNLQIKRFFVGHGRESIFTQDAWGQMMRLFTYFHSTPWGGAAL